MKPITKKIITGGIIILLIFISFGGGFYFGIDFAYKLYKPSYETDLYVRTMLAQSTIETIDENKISEGHRSILARLNGDIIAMDSFLAEANDSVEKNKMHNLLARIARHREKYPKYYQEVENNTPELNEANTMVVKILEKYKK